MMTRYPALPALAASLLLLSACSVATRTPAAKPQQQAPDFTLPDQQNAPHKVKELTGEGGYAVLVFYRGHW